MQIHALDRDFNMITPDIPYVNLQWTRRYFEPGEFELQVIADAFDPSWAFIISPDRPELAMVQAVEKSAHDKTVQVSGFFAEKWLDDRVCFPRHIDSGVTEDVCGRMFTRFGKGLPIALAPAHSPALGDATTCDFSDDPLGRKLYRVLETRGMSMSVTLDYLNNRCELSFWRGHDRTQGNVGGAPWYVFSTAFGNIANVEVKRDWSGAANVCLVPAAKNDAGAETVTVVVDLSGGGERREVVLDKRGEQLREGQSLEAFKTALEQAGRERLDERAPVESIDITVGDVSGYLTDYDLGDRCHVEVPELGVFKKLRIIEVREVFKSSGHEFALEFGNNKRGGSR